MRKTHVANFSPHVRQSKAVLDFGFQAAIPNSMYWIPDFVSGI